MNRMNRMIRIPESPNNTSYNNSYILRVFSPLVTILKSSKLVTLFTMYYTRPFIYIIHGLCNTGETSLAFNYKK